MVTAFYSHPICIDHEPGPYHPENSGRLQAIETALAAPVFEALAWTEAPITDPEVIHLLHDPAYVEMILNAVPEEGYKALDPDTFMSPASGEAALRAVGGICAAVDQVVTGGVVNAFCALRPPGHHAEQAQAMGFCLFNNVAIGARHAQIQHGLGKIAVVDFDVHHGNGTQHMFENDADLFYASSHQFPAYPGTGAANETGIGNIVNVPLGPGTGSAPFRAAYSDHILPALRNFSPDLLMISAGFDAHIRDPLCQLDVMTEDFAWVTEELLNVAEDSCGGRVVSTLEGGYDYEALAECAAVHVTEMMAR